MALRQTARQDCRRLRWRRATFRPLLELLEARLAPATFAVSTTIDTIAIDLTTGKDANGDISLRSAIMAANNLAGSNSISLPAGSYNLTIAGANEDAGASGDLDIKNNLTINGTGSAVIDAKGLDRAFQVFGGFNVAISNVTIQGGVAQGGAGAVGAGGGGGGAGMGGGIFNQGTLALTGVTMTANTARGGNGGDGTGAFNSGFGGGGGGGIGGSGAANSSINGGAGGPPNGGSANGGSGDEGGGGGGGFGSTAGNAGGTGGFAGGGGGGGSTSLNTLGATGGGGGDGGFGGGGGGGGGGIIPGGGGAEGFGGGAGATGPDGGGGGGAGMGGAIFNRSGTLTLTNCTLAGNTAAGGAAGNGGLGGGNGSAFGGAAFNYNGTVTIVNSTLAANVLTAGGGAAAAGGAVYSLSIGSIFAKANVNLTNSILADTANGYVDLVNNEVDGFATVTATAPNIVESRTTSGGATTLGSGIITTDPGLDVLADNGGPTKTMKLLGAAAFNVGTTTGAPTTDQRGLAHDSQPDLGAFEVQPIIVTSLADSGTGTLRQAILDANASAYADTIKFDPAIAGGTVVLSSAGDTSLGRSALAISSPITIAGTGETLKGTFVRHFIVSASGNLTLHDLTLTSGRAQGGDGGAGGGGGGGGAGMGGAILNQGALTLTGVTLSGNVAYGGNGGDGLATNFIYGGGGGGGLLGRGQNRVESSGGAGGDGGGGTGGNAGDAGAGGGNGGLGGGGGGGGASSGFNRGGDGGAGGFGGGGGGAVGSEPGVGGAGGFGAGNGANQGGFGGGGGGGAGLGGGIFNYGGTVTLTNSTFSQNKARGGDGGGLDPTGAPGGSGFGGALFNFIGTVTVTNSTFADNRVEKGAGNGAGSAAGGAIYNLEIPFLPAATLNLTNTILADSTGGNDVVNSGGTVAGSKNLIETSMGVPAAVILTTADPKLKALANNGGLMETVALLADSPAIDAGTDAGAPPSDQRGAPRNGPVDLGAFEFVPNHVPSFALGPPQDATDESGPICVPAFAKDILPGPAYEAGQQVSFLIAVNKPELFTSSPTIDTMGQLCFTPAPNVRDIAIVTVQILDDGGTANGGVDTSQPQMFNINITKPHLWRNTIKHLDANNDTHIAANDALAVIDYINAFGSFMNGQVPPAGTMMLGMMVDSGKPFGFIDVNGDAFVAANDVLDVINAINAGQGGEGEGSGFVVQASGEGSQEPGARSHEAGQMAGDLMALLAADVAWQPKRRW